MINEISEFYGDLKHDNESVDLRLFDIDKLPENIIPTQIEYIEKFVSDKRK